ncbi:SMC-Scp complex subunit ScpB [Candidatus Kaiserbacteria bacterium]|nr:SMC-Scp complex subunit ScpB [Candidatus Kaiserbacteria bacterium]
MTDNLTARAEAFLFSEGGTLTLRKLAQLLGVKEPQLQEALADLFTRLEGTGLALIKTDTEVSLVVAKETSQAVQKAYERELAGEIGDAGLEVLAIVLYRGSSTRAQIDYIRGVNTSWTIRNLLTRGLLERTGNPEDGREYLYRPTVELLSHIGVRDLAELPNHAEIVAELKAFEAKPADAPSDG